jgi:O-6-methylguanine DNA methyltransferase
MLFKERVLAAVRAIPVGSVLTYKEVAVRAGSPGACRAVGSIMKNNYDPSVPCHRVIRSSGRIGEYNRGAEKKVALLRAEGYLK